MTNNLEDDISAIVAGMDNQESQDNPQTPPEDIQDIYVLIVREQEEDQKQIVDSAPIVPAHPVPTPVQKDSFLSAYLFVCFALFLILATLTSQLYCIQNPLIATVTVIPTSQQVTLNGTIQLGRVLPALTISQSQTTLATGKGHQPAVQATGYLTFYNGQFQTVTIAAGTILTGASGIQIITDQDAPIPAGSPATGYGHITVSAHASILGSKGNIPAYDINQACCATSVLAANLTSFQGGQDARTYTTVTHNDIHNISTVLKTSLTHSVTGALQGQRTPQEQLYILPCTPTVTTDHPIGAEAASVKVTVSQTCSALTYNSQGLQTKATALLTHQATTELATGYSLLGAVTVSVTQTTVTSTPPHLVFLSFKASGMWVYGLTQIAQEQIKHQIAGKTTQQAQNLLAALPGVESAAIRFSGFGDATRLPKSTGYIHINLIIM